MLGIGVPVWDVGLGFRVWVLGSGFRVWCFDLRFRVSGLMVSILVGLGFEV